MFIQAARSRSTRRDFRRSGIDDCLDFADGVGREAATIRMFANYLLVGSGVNAVDFVGGYEAFHPLDLRTHAAQDAAGFLGDDLQFFRPQTAGSGNVSLDNVFRHGGDSTIWPHE